MSLQWRKLPLFNEPVYSYSIPLEGNTYNIKLTFVEKIQSWVFSLKDSEKNDLVVGQRLTPDTLLFRDYKLPELSGGFFFKPKANVDPETIKDTIKNLIEFYDFYYVYDDEV